jgi:glyoxylase-like metal-dependent hydrolase (beta-lactamase superfamily II)
MPFPSPVPTDHDHGALECGESSAGLSRRNLLAIGAAMAAAGVVGTAAGGDLASATPPGTRTRPLTLERLVPGFLDIAEDQIGNPIGDGWGGRTNPWGAYTAHRISITESGLRTWRIDNLMLQAPRPDGTVSSQDSTCWLFEGTERALLVDTAQNTPETVGVNDLSSVARHLLGHRDNGTVKADPVDFDVAITHSHGDHTGKLFQMTDRTVYYPDLDWPTATVAPPHWVPVREDGGPTTHGNGKAVSRIRLGGRTIKIIALYGHTPGSTGYLDADNLMIATGDALGSAFVWAQFASATTSSYVKMLRGLERQLTPLRGIVLLPAHYLQLSKYGRGHRPLNGRIGDLRYVKDLARAAQGALDGSIPAEPYHHVGREAVWISGGSARMVFSLTNMYPGGPTGGQGVKRDYHRVEIPSTYPLEPTSDAPYAYLQNIKTQLTMIRDYATRSLFLMRGNSRALLIGTGAGTPGLADYVRRLLRGTGLPLDVLLTSDDADQIGGLRQFAKNRVYVSADSSLTRRRHPDLVRLEAGDTIDLGRDSARRRVRLEVHPLAGHASEGLTLLDPVSRVLYAGDALGTQGTAGLILTSTLTEFSTALAGWRTGTDRRYDTLYTAHNHQWFTRPAYVDSLAAAAAAGLADDGAFVASPLPGHRGLTSGTTDVTAWIHVPNGS